MGISTSKRPESWVLVVVARISADGAALTVREHASKKAAAAISEGKKLGLRNLKFFIGLFPPLV
jgi:hypothetical protein